MSLASEMDDNDKDFPTLKPDFSNWIVWIEKAEDYLLGAKHHKADTMITAARWVPADGGADPALAFRQLPITSKPEQEFIARWFIKSSGIRIHQAQAQQLPVPEDDRHATQDRT